MNNIKQSINRVLFGNWDQHAEIPKIKYPIKGQWPIVKSSFYPVRQSFNETYSHIHKELQQVV